jgi:hypothetical protein
MKKPKTGKVTPSPVDPNADVKQSPEFVKFEDAMKRILKAPKSTSDRLKRL